MEAAEGDQVENRVWGFQVVAGVSFQVVKGFVLEEEVTKEEEMLMEKMVEEVAVCLKRLQELEEVVEVEVVVRSHWRRKMEEEVVEEEVEVVRFRWRRKVEEEAI